MNYLIPPVDLNMFESSLQSNKDQQSSRSTILSNDKASKREAYVFTDMENSNAYYRKISLAEETKLKLPNMRQTIETLNED